MAYEIKRRPALAAMVEAIDTTTRFQIEASGFPKWIRQALIQMQEQKKKDIESAYLLAKNSELIVDGYRPDPEGQMNQWTGPDAYVRLDRGSSLQVCYGQYLWFPKTGGVWIETIFSKMIDPRVFKDTRIIGMVLKSEYIRTYKEFTAKINPGEHPVIMAQGGNISPLARYGVRIG
jgi:hypothetical protein